MYLYVCPFARLSPTLNLRHGGIQKLTLWPRGSAWRDSQRSTPMDTHSGVPLGQDLCLPHCTRWRQFDSLHRCVLRWERLSYLHYPLACEQRPWSSSFPSLTYTSKPEPICTDKKSAWGSYKKQDVTTSLPGALESTHAVDSSLFNTTQCCHSCFNQGQKQAMQLPTPDVHASIHPLTCPTLRVLVWVVGN